jgi:hypothetical protein
VGGIPMNSPSWRPLMTNRAASRSPVATKSSSSTWAFGKAV